MNQTLAENGLRSPWDGIHRGVVTSTLVLTGIGIIIMFSASADLGGERFSPTFLRHVSAVFMGFLAVLGLTFVPLGAIRRLALPFWCVSLVMLAATLVMGTIRNGAERWLTIPGIGLSFQPGELVKLATVLAVAVSLSRDPTRPVHTPRDWFPAVGIALVPTALLILQPDFGNAMILLVLTAVLIFAAGAPFRLFLAPGLAVGLFGGGYVALNPYAQNRVTAFLHAWETSQTVGFQLVQSFVAFARGGLAGVGLGNGRQKLGYLPEAHTDFILSTLAEELGLIGVLAVIACFAWFLLAGSRIARGSKDRLSMLIAFGMTTLIAIPASINIAVVTGMVPTKGLTLPLLSYGRTSLLTSALAIGILLSIGRRNALENHKQILKSAKPELSPVNLLPKRATRRPSS